MISLSSSAHGQTPNELTEVNIHDNVASVEVRRHIAVGTREVRARGTLACSVSKGKGDLWRMLTQLSVLMVLAPFLTSEGIFEAERGQNQTLMNEFVRSIA